jgi:hypothetical protein
MAFARQIELFNSTAKNKGKEREVPLPQSPENLQQFLNSSDGVEYKKAFKDSINRIAMWAKKNNIDPAQGFEFYRRITGYSGGNVEQNRIQYPLYMEGIPLLGMIVPLLEDEKLPLHVRQREIGNMLSSFRDVCSPGCHTHIANTYTKLVSYGHLDLQVRALYLEISQQCVLECLKELKENRIETAQGYEIHYVNAVLNHYAKYLGIDILEDEYADYLSKNANTKEILYKLYQRFQEKIENRNLSEQVIISLVSNIDFDELLEKMNGSQNKDEPSSSQHKEPVYNTEAVTDFFRDITNRFDISSKEGQPLNEGNIWAVNAEGELYKPYSLRWDVHYNTFVHIYTNFTERYLKLDKKRQSEFIYSFKDVTVTGMVHYIPGNSLKYAYITLPKNFSAEIYNSSSSAFIPYFVEVMSGNDDRDTAKREALLCFTAIRFTAEQQAELVSGICEYVKSIEFTSLKREEQESIFNRLIDRLLLLNHKNNAKMLQILKVQSPELAIKAFSYLQGKIASNDLRADLEQLSPIIGRFPTEKRMECLSDLGITSVTNTIKNIKDLSIFLKLIPAENQLPFLKRFLASDSLAFDKTSIINLLKQLPENDRYQLINEIDVSQVDDSKIREIMTVLPEKDCLSFTKALKEKYKKVVSIAMLLDLLSRFSDEDKITFISLMGNEFYQTLASSSFDQLKNIFQSLTPALRLDIFKKLIKENNKIEMLKDKDNFFQFIELFEQNQLPEALKAIPNPSTFITSDTQLFSLLNKLPKACREEFMSKINLGNLSSEKSFPVYLKMLSLLPTVRRNDVFLATNGKEILQKICKNSGNDYLLSSYNYGNVKPDEIFALLGKDFFKEIIRNGEDFYRFLRLANFKNDPERLVATFGLTVLGFLIKPYDEEKVAWNGDDYVSTGGFTRRYPWELISENHRYHIFEQLCKADPNFATQNLHAMLKALSCDTWEAFHEDVLGKKLVWQELFHDYNCLEKQLDYYSEKTRIILSKCWTVLSKLEIVQILEVINYLPTESRLAFILENDAKVPDNDKILPKMQDPQFFPDFLRKISFGDWQYIFNHFKDHLYPDILTPKTVLKLFKNTYAESSERFIQLLIEYDTSDNKSKSELLLKWCLRELDGRYYENPKDLIRNYLLKIKLNSDFEAIGNAFKDQKGSSRWKTIINEYEVTQNNNNYFSNALNNTEARIKLFEAHLDAHLKAFKSLSLNTEGVMELLRKLNSMYIDLQEGSVFKPQLCKQGFFSRTPHDQRQYTKVVDKLEKQAREILNSVLNENSDHRPDYRKVNKELLDVVVSMPILAKYQKKIESKQASYCKQTLAGR